MDISVCVTDEDYEAWRQVRIAVVPGERSDTVAEMRVRGTPDRLRLLATMDGIVVGSGLADRSDSQGGGYVAPRVLPEHRRRGVGSALLKSLAAHVTACFETFGTEVLADFALFEPLQINAQQWASSWAGDPMFLAVFDGEVIGCAGLFRDTDRPERAENALTAVRREWRGRGIASHLKRRTLLWAADHGLSELYTWTQARNVSMLRLNEHLGYATGQVSITVSRPLPL